MALFILMKSILIAPERMCSHYATQILMMAANRINSSTAFLITNMTTRSLVMGTVYRIQQANSQHFFKNVFFLPLP
jgi:hypothetical protein